MDNNILVALLALVGALLTALLSTFAAEHYRRFRDSQALAGALAGELGSYAEAWPMIKENFGAMIKDTIDGRRAVLPTKMEKPKDRIFESCVSQIGSLGPELAEDLAYVYNNLNAFRATFALVAEEELPHRQGALLTAALACVTRAHERGANLPAKLKNYARRPYVVHAALALTGLVAVVAALVGLVLWAASRCPAAATPSSATVSVECGQVHVQPRAARDLAEPTK